MMKIIIKVVLFIAIVLFVGVATNTVHLDKFLERIPIPFVKQLLERNLNVDEGQKQPKEVEKLLTKPEASAPPKELTTKLSPARDLKGRWAGTGPHGAFYRDNVANPACSYEADMALEITEQKNNTISGLLSLTIRRATPLLKNIPCIPEGMVALNKLPVIGMISSTFVTFSHPGLPGVFSPITFSTNNHKGQFTEQIMSGSFERSPLLGGDLTGMVGEWIVTRAR